MPYKSIDELPGSVKKLGPEAQSMWLKVFNSAAKQYGDESRWFATAWAAVNKKYGKSESLVERVDRLLFEAAKQPSDLESTNAKIVVAKHGTDIWIAYADVETGEKMTTRDPVHGHVVMRQAPFKEVASKTHYRVTGGCARAFIVQLTHAKGGWGPLLYDVAIEYASKHGSGLAPDRHQVSPAARKVWAHYRNRRSDVKKHQLDNPENELTKPVTDNCTQVSTGDDFPDGDLAQRYSKSGTPVMDKLKKLGRLETKSL